MDINNVFIAQKKKLVFYAGKPIINKRFAFYDIDGNPWNFSFAESFRFRVWEEREDGQLMIDWDDSNITAENNELILNSQADVTDIERGKYYYEIEYTIAGGYGILIGYDEAMFI